MKTEKKKYDKLHIDSPKKEIDLEEWKDISRLIQFMRNESHRFALNKHKARRTKTLNKLRS